MATALKRADLLFTLNSAMFSGFPKIPFFSQAPGWGWVVEQAAVYIPGWIVLLMAVSWTSFFYCGILLASASCEQLSLTCSEIQEEI